MWVTVIGSFHPESKARGWTLRHSVDEFARACEAIGSQLASGGHELIVAHTEVSTADKLAMTGFDKDKKSGARTAVFMTHPSGVWAEAHLGAVEHSDAVIAIGGGDGTYAAGQAALLSGKRLLAIPCFGGAAENLCRLQNVRRRCVISDLERL